MIIRGARVFTAGSRFDEKDIYIRNGHFAEAPACAGSFPPCSEAANEEILDAAGLLALPGLVDTHFHGALGHDFCESSVPDLKAIAEYEARCGVTAICPATMTYPEAKLSRICDTAAEFARLQKSFANSAGYSPETDCTATLVGIHMEGPFLSPMKLGAQNPSYVQKPDAGMVRRLQERSGNFIKIVDVAPEVEGAVEFISELQGNVTLSLAHTCTDYETAERAFEAGATRLTHMFNAMPGIHHRNPGPIPAAFEAEADAELIADGIHVHPAVVRMAFSLFGHEHMILISDSMEAAGLGDGTYQLGGQSVTKKGSLAVLTEHPGTIAGSVTNLWDCMRFAVREAGVPLAAAVRAASLNPAKSIGIESEYGSIEPGKIANLVLADEDLNRKLVILRGKALR